MRLSLNKNEYNLRYRNPELYKANQNTVSFRGLSHNLIKAVSGAMDRSSVLTKSSQKFDVASTLKTIRKRIGLSADVLFEHIKGDEIISQGLNQESGKIQFKNKRPLRLLIDGILYPIAKIPFYILYGTLNKLKSFNFIKNSNWLKKFENSSFYNVTHSYMKKDDKLNALKGLMEVGSKDNVIGAKARAKSFLQNTAKTFDSRFGNYNGVHERALTRIVTGFIPAFFLANDAYNLSILCTNNKKDAQNEKDLRFKQESRRVLSNAYIQLITLGALSKFINMSKAWFVGVTVGTVLFTEIYSRLRTGKRIDFISPEEAREINNKEKQKKLQDKAKQGLTFVLDESPNPITVNLNGVNRFIKNPSYNKFSGINKKPEIQNEKPKQKDEKSRSILSFGTVMKYFGAVIVAGFALKGLKKLPLGKGHVGDIFDSVAKTYKKIYNKITMKPNYLKKSEMEKVVEKMRRCNFDTLAEGYVKVIMDHQRLLMMPKHITQEVIEAVRKTGNSELAKHLEAFATGKNQKEMLEGLKSDVIKHNIELLKRYLKLEKADKLYNEVAELTKDGKIDYAKLRKVFAKSDGEKYREIFENSFAIDDNTLKRGMLIKTRNVLRKAGNMDLWKAVEQKTKADIDAKVYFDLGKKKIPFVKDCIEPFKFLWTYSTISYNGLKKLGGVMKVSPRKASNDIDVVATAMNSLTKKLSMSDKAFTDMFNEKIVKGFNSTSMSKIANSDLSSLAKTASTITTMSFLVSDNYNMVMLKSNGKNQDEAIQKGKERFIQELSRFLWQQMFINMFNNSFAHTYNASLLGASVVNAASTLATETCTRKSVSLPITASTREEITQLEKDNLSGDGLKSKFFRFMSKLTGKKILSERENNKKREIVSPK